MARSLFCSRCKNEKGEGRERESYCKECKHAKRSEDRAKRRAENGLRPWSSGPNPNCIDCNAVKENIKQSYCNPCRSKRSKIWALETGRIKAHKPVSTGLCPCGAERAPNQVYFCQTCKAADSRRYRATKGQSQENRDKYNAWYEKNKIDILHKRKYDNIYRLKVLARQATTKAIASGFLEKRPCEICWATEDIEAHHDDYTKPLEVRWLCVKHHKMHHVMERLKLKEK